MKKKVIEFKRLLNTGKAIIAPGVYDALSAKIAEKLGFEMVAMTGHGTSLGRIGQTDVGLLTETEMARNAGLIANAINIPLLADADTGYGNAVNVIRTVMDFEMLGVAGIHIEDQIAPKRCGHMAGKMLISIEEMVGKIRAAIDTRRDEDFVVVARTDARGAVGGSLDEAIKRGVAYAEAGADVIFAEFTSTSDEEAESFAKAIHEVIPGKPLMFNYSTAFKWHKSPLSFKRLEELGFNLIVLPLQVTRSIIAAAWDFLVDLRNRGEKAVYDQEQRLKGHPTEDYHAFGGFPDIIKLEEKYLPKEDFKRKYDNSIGFIKLEESS